MSDMKFISSIDLLDYLHFLENKSTCAAKKVGCAIFRRVDNDNFEILAGGWNASIGPCKCNELFEKKNGIWFKNNKECESNAHKIFSDKYEIHAEMMALNNLNKSEYLRDPSQIEVLSTYSSCINCAKHLLYNNIQRAFYINPFDDITEVERMYTILETPLIQIRKASDINAS